MDYDNDPEVPCRNCIEHVADRARLCAKVAELEARCATAEAQFRDAVESHQRERASLVESRDEARARVAELEVAYGWWTGSGPSAVRALEAEARVAELEAERDKWKRRAEERRDAHKKLAFKVAELERKLEGLRIDRDMVLLRAQVAEARAAALSGGKGE